MKNFNEYRKQLLDQEYNTAPLKEYRKIRFVLIYPNLYEVGISNLGFLNVYNIINGTDAFICERGFLYEPPFENITKTLESGSEYASFDIVAFSINYELDLFNLIKILKNSKIPVYSKDRTGKHPLLIAGGSFLSINPAPVTNIFDILFIGESETLLPFFLDKLKDYSKNEIVEALNGYKGILIPNLFKSPVKKAYEKNLESISYFPPVVTKNSHMSDSYLIETGRGCGRGCRFCAAFSIYSPVRFLKFEYIRHIIDKYTENFDKIGLVGASISDHPELEKMIEYIVSKDKKIGLSSFRPDRISKTMLDNLQEGSVNTITIAPEAASENLRTIINKKITDERIYDAVNLLSVSKIKNLKLYFMVGLPGETGKDIENIIEMVKNIHMIYSAGSKKTGKIRLSINIFIPKPFTVFQFETLKNIKVSDKKRKHIYRELRNLPGISFSVRGSRLEYVQGIISQGTSNIVQDIMKSGCDFSVFLRLLKNEEEYTYINKVKTAETRLPWEIIDNYINKGNLWSEFKKIIP